MKKKILAAIAMGLAVSGAALLLTAEYGIDASAAPPAKKTAGATAQLPAGSSATEVYEKLTKEVEALSKQAMQATAPAEQMKYFSDIEGKFTAFRAKYPNTPEAHDAAFQLGAMNFGLQKFDQAVTLLKEFLSKSKTAQRDQQAFAHYYLAECYRWQSKYDLAETEYKLIMANYSDVNKELTTQVKGNLSMLSTERKLAVGAEPVDFNVKSIDGKTLSPAAFKGKVLLIDFWATWCGPCVAEMPNVKQVYDKYHPKGFEIVGISLDQSRDRRYLRRRNASFRKYDRRLHTARFQRQAFRQ